MAGFQQLFLDATGSPPYPYQEALATGTELPEALIAPTGAGKTAAVVLSWLYRRRFSSPEVRVETPRRLVLCFPMRTLVSQAERACRGWLERLGLLDEGRGLDRGAGIGLHVWMGGATNDDAHLHPEKDAIFLGTQDMLLSRALNRGYGSSRFRWPWDFALFSNDCLWVFDEIQLMGSGLATGLQLDAFRKSLGTCGPSSSLFMSATLDPRWLNTVDHPTPGRVHCLGTADLDSAELKKRRTAPKSLGRAQSELKKDDLKPLAKEVAEHHLPGTRTLVILNTVDRAGSLFAALEKEKSLKGTRCVLLHSRFRPPERAAALTEATRSGFDGIVVSTQVIEAGVDISSKTLFTELAPWPSFVQRAGRCNRFGEFDRADIFWIDQPAGTAIDEKAALPYESSELESAQRALSSLTEASCEALENAGAPLGTPDFPHVIRKRDLIDLFDTTPDLSGADIDVSRFIREGEERDVQVFWRDLGGEAPARDIPAARREELCPVPFLSLRKAIEGRKAFRWNHLDGEWKAVTGAAVFPGCIYLLNASEGGYSERTGWDPKSKTPVSVLARPGLPEEDVTSDPWSEVGKWVSLSTHASDTGHAMTEILDALSDPGLPVGTLVTAARAHDLGKSHPVFQETMRRSRPENETEILWAKSGLSHLQHGRRGFRHELASALAWLQNGPPEERELISYLLAAHHGKVRLSLRSLPRDAQPDDPRRLNSRGVFDGDELPETDLGAGGCFSATTLSLGPMQMGREDGRPSWTEMVLSLRERFGPMRLAYLEMLVRAADVRASMREEKK